VIDRKDISSFLREKARTTLDLEEHDLYSAAVFLLESKHDCTLQEIVEELAMRVHVLTAACSSLEEERLRLLSKIEEVNR